MGDKVVYFPGPTRHDLPAKRVIDALSEREFDEIIIAGFTADGEEYFATNLADGGDALWLAERFKKALLSMPDGDE